MTDATPIRRAILAPYDKTGLADFARALVAGGVELIASGGTARVLTEAGLPVTSVETVTGSPEMLGGRVKTLHPKIHAGLLADRRNPEHERQLEEQGIAPFDLLVAGLYPFRETVASGRGPRRGDREHRHRRSRDDARGREELRVRRGRGQPRALRGHHR